MITHYKFFRTKDGISSYAEIALESAQCKEHSISWLGSAIQAKSAYGYAIETGVEAAYHQHLQMGGATACIQIVEILEVLVDTTPDAMRCAATLATWLALGHNETDVVVVYDGGWNVSFQES